MKPLGFYDRLWGILGSKACLQVGINEAGLDVILTSAASIFKEQIETIGDLEIPDIDLGTVFSAYAEINYSKIANDIRYVIMLALRFV